MKKQRVFIGSATKDTTAAKWLQVALESAGGQKLEATPWPDGVFELSETTIESLFNATRTFDFAVLLFSPTDIAFINGGEHKTARDNVIFETGLFIGALGRSRVVIVKPKNVDLHLPTDLNAVTYAEYDGERLGSQPLAALNECSLKVSQHIMKNVGSQPATHVKADVEIILELAARLVADRARVKPEDIRAFCHLYNHSDQRLDVFECFARERKVQDLRLRVPCSGNEAEKDVEDWFIISRCFREGRYKCENVDWEKCKSLDLQALGITENVWKDLKAVAAYPIHEFGNKSNKIGVVSVDSSKTIEQIKWNNYSNLENILCIIGNHIYAKMQT